ncbi:MAG TPA: hypothetical protein VGH38_28195 [Bryobacteraceae bacterium]
MKLAITAAFWGLLTTAIPPAFPENQAASLSQVKHLTVFPVNAVRPVLLSALAIQRGAEYPAEVELKGAVEIRTRVCIMQGKTKSKKGGLVCDGETVLRAEEAIFHEDTGAVEAQGKVTLTTVPYRRRSE